MAPQPSSVFCSSACRCCKPAILVALVVRTVEAFRVFDIIYVITTAARPLAQ